MIQLYNVSWKPGGFCVLRDVSAVIKPASCTLLLGSNGSGKTSLLDIISGKKQPTSGEIWRDNQHITHDPEHQKAAYIFRVFQDPRQNTVSHATPVENVVLMFTRHRRIPLRLARHSYASARKLLISRGFPRDACGVATRYLSGGQRQLLACIMATVYQPDLLILDEPTAALDLEHTRMLRQWIRQWHQEHHLTMLMVTHAPEFMQELRTDIWHLEHGTLVCR